ncbi:MAG: ABC transporter substrate-binding protein [Clostridiales bacterium]|nr:ABC transporter substrate-binding protein [Clostridiales bacterium]
MKKAISIFLAVLMAASLLTACKKTGNASLANADSDEIKIGVFEPITGANGAGGSMEVQGIKLANKLYPEVLGKKVKLIIEDNKSDKVEAANAAKRLIEQDKVSAVIGSWGSSLAMAAGPTAKMMKVPIVGASCTNPNVTKNNDYYFRVCFIDPFQGTVMANFAFKDLHAKSAAIIQEVSNDYSVGLAKFFMDSFIKLTGNKNAILSQPLNYQTGDQDFSSQLTTIKKLNADVIFAPGNFTESALLIKQARQLGIKTPIIGGDTWEADEFLQLGGSAVEGAVFSTFFAKDKPLNSESEKFLKEFDAEYKGKEPSAVSALGYDAYRVILDAIKRAGSADSVKIRDELAKTKDFVGAAGNITFDEDRNAIKNAVIKKVEGGKFKYMTTIEPENN